MIGDCRLGFEIGDMKLEIWDCELGLGGIGLEIGIGNCNCGLCLPS